MAKKPSRAAAPAPAGTAVRVIRLRGVTLDGVHHPRGSNLVLSANQLADLSAAGIVCTRPAVTPEPAPVPPAKG